MFDWSEKHFGVDKKFPVPSAFISTGCRSMVYRLWRNKYTGKREDRAKEIDTEQSIDTREAGEEANKNCYFNEFLRKNNLISRKKIAAFPPLYRMPRFTRYYRISPSN